MVWSYWATQAVRNGGAVVALKTKNYEKKLNGEKEEIDWKRFLKGDKDYTPNGSALEWDFLTKRKDTANQFREGENFFVVTGKNAGEIERNFRDMIGDKHN